MCWKQVVYLCLMSIERINKTSKNTLCFAILNLHFTHYVKIKEQNSKKRQANMHSKGSLTGNKIVHLLSHEGERWILVLLL
jgi:hypothetical protein